MAQHDVQFNIPYRPLGHADVAFVVKCDGEKLGELHVSKGAVVWVGNNKTYGRRLSWQKLAELFEAEGTKRKP